MRRVVESTLRTLNVAVSLEAPERRRMFRALRRSRPSGCGVGKELLFDATRANVLLASDIAK
jgi:hypothetical protein